MKSPKMLQELIQLQSQNASGSERDRKTVLLKDLSIGG